MQEWTREETVSVEEFWRLFSKSSRELMSTRGTGGLERRGTETEPVWVGNWRNTGEEAALETEMPSTFQAWMGRKIVVTLTEISKSAGRAGWGGGSNESQFGYVEFEMPSSLVRKDVKQADMKAVPVSKHLLGD